MNLYLPFIYLQVAAGGSVTLSLLLAFFIYVNKKGGGQAPFPLAAEQEGGINHPANTGAAQI
jgi:hypothetical protein